MNTLAPNFALPSPGAFFKLEHDCCFGARVFIHVAFFKLEHDSCFSDTDSSPSTFSLQDQNYFCEGSVPKKLF